MKKVIIIGSGLSGLSASCYLAQNNFNVTIIEKNDSVGGRLSKFEKDGFVFDMGPSWYWMPDVFENFFNDFGRKVSDYYKLKRLNPSYKFFLENSELELSSEFKKLCNSFESIEKGSSVKLEQFINQSEKKYKISMDNFIGLSNSSLKDYLSLNIFKHFLSLDLLKSLRTHIGSYFKNNLLTKVLEFPSMFLGGTPNNTPALYSLMNYADIKGGTWYPMGGMYEITKGFEKLSLELGVKHILNEEINNFNMEGNKIKSVVSANNKLFEADLIICCAEYPHVQMNLVSPQFRSYSKNYWSKRKVAPSALLFYLGLSERIDKFVHHNLFFDEDFDNHLEDIFEKDIWPENPLFYVCCPSKTDISVVPDKGKENLFVLIPIASDSIDNDELRDKYYKIIIDRIEKLTSQNISDKVISKTSFCVNDFKDRYNAYKGNAYGLANTLFQTAIFKPKVKDKKIDNLFYTGHFTVPGPGLPPAVISGKIVSDEIIKEIN